MDSQRRSPRMGFRDELFVLAARAGQVWRLIPARRRRTLGAAALVMAIASACQVAIPLSLGRLIDHLQGGARQGLASADLCRAAALDLAVIAAAYLLRECLNVVRRYLVEGACLAVEKEMSVRVVSHLLKMDLAALARQRVGALHGRIHRSVAGFVRFLRVAFLDFFPAVLTGVLALAATLGKQPALGLVMMGVIPAALGLTLWQLRSQTGVRLALMRSKENLDGTVVEQLGGMDYVRAADTHGREVSRVARAAEEHRARDLRHHFRMSLFGSGKALNEALFHLVVLGMAVYFAAAGSIGVGDVWTFSLLFLNVMTPLSEVHRVLDEAHESSLQVERLLGLLAEPVDLSFRTAPARPPRLESGAAAFAVEDLHVDYLTGDGKRKPALRGATLSVRQGETLGIAGRSGGGKTTWLRVLLRLTHPCRGRAWLGGVPLETVSREALGRLVGYVGQVPFVFAGTVADNIAYGCESATRQEIERAARMACLHDEIRAMPGGYEAPVAERGQNLSGGQKQRIALARVFLKDPPILVLDEATSALDAVSEWKVQRAIEAARKGRTVILVAHRLSTLRHADRVAVFDGGRVAEVGMYAELVHGGGPFAEMARCAGDGQGAGRREDHGNSTGPSDGVGRAA
jgi:ATP-binding cassette subfamily B protein